MTALLEMRGISKRFGPVTALCRRQPLRRGRRDPRARRRERRRQVDADEGAERRLPAGSYDGHHPLRRPGAAVPLHPRQRGAGDHHHPPGTGADPAALDRREHLPRQPAVPLRRDRPRAPPTPHQGAARSRSAWRETPDTKVGDLGIGKQQLVEIAKALSKEVRLLILDEPTASLNERDSAALLRLLAEFRTRGISSILISHKLNEISTVADRITVLRDGRTIETIDCADGPVPEDRIIRGMVNRDMDHRFPPHDAARSATKCSGSSTGRPGTRSTPSARSCANVELPCAPGRDRGHRRADGRGADGVRHERVRPRLGQQGHRPGARWTASRSTSRACRARSPPGSPM